MPDLVIAMIAAVFRALRSRRDLVLENLALRHQLAVLNRTAKHRRLSSSDRLFWVVLSHWWHRWKDIIVIVTPETVIRWHRAAFRAFWTRPSKKCRPGRPPTNRDTRDLIRRISAENPLWGAPRIHGEIKKLGIEVSHATISKLIRRERKPPSQSWRTFLKNHAPEIAAIDFFTVATGRFRVL